LNGPQGGAVFHSAIADVKANHPLGAQVALYSPEEYAGMRTFLSDDKKVGFSIKPDGDIVSVFSGRPGTGRALLDLAVSQGGRKLDAFDTYLPQLYGAKGFRAVARTRFVDEFAPEGWDAKKMGDWNGGKPDVVFMVYDPKHAKEGRAYQRGDGRMYPDYDSAAAAQQSWVERLTPKKKAKKKARGGPVTFDDLRDVHRHIARTYAMGGPVMPHIVGGWR
jgi:hypothetical protein